MRDWSEQAALAEAADGEAMQDLRTSLSYWATPYDPDSSRGSVLASLGKRVALGPDLGWAKPERGLIVAVYDDGDFKASVCCVECVDDCALGLATFLRPGKQIVAGDRYVARWLRTFWPNAADQ